MRSTSKTDSRPADFPRAEPVRIRYAGLLGWVLPVGAAMGLVGAWPTWRLGGPEALHAKAVAGGIVLLAVLLSGLVVRFAAAAGPGHVALAFVVSGLFRMFACAAAGALLAWRSDLHGVALLVWVGLFYLALLPAEAAWVARSLRRHALGPPLEAILRYRPMTPMEIE